MFTTCPRPRIGGFSLTMKEDTVGSFKSSVLAELAWRDRIEQQTHEELDEKLAAGSMTLYCGFDPSADSLHVGNLVPMMGLAFFLRHGHRPLALVGGATGRIGDPSGKATERSLLSVEQIEANLRGIHAQLETILARALTMHPEGLHREDAAPAGVPIVNNHDWFKDWGFLDFLREVGKHFRVNTMLAKDSVRNRLENREQGISYTEFSYMLIQGFDFLHLAEAHGCQLQIGGSDQWGNITAGTELIRRKRGESAYGLTMPLLTSSTGQKFGKSEKGAVWLDAQRTSPYEFYQYWINRADADLELLLKTFTFLPREEIDALVRDVNDGQNRGQVQKKLAWEVTALVHGVDEAEKAVAASRMLFGERIAGLSDRDLTAIFADVPSTEVPRERFDGEGVELIGLMAEVGLQQSKGAARRLVKQGGGYINNERVSDAARVTLGHLASESMIVLRAGKKNYHVLKLV